jgi:hypothetical protein
MDFPDEAAAGWLEGAVHRPGRTADPASVHVYGMEFEIGLGRMHQRAPSWSRKPATRHRYR